MSVVAVEDQIVAAGAELVWVMERTAANAPGTAENCMSFMTQIGATKGWCVGDSQTSPTAFAFDDSPFSVGRGFDMIVPTQSMVVRYSSSHGSSAGNDNPSGQDVLAELQTIIASLP